MEKVLMDGSDNVKFSQIDNKTSEPVGEVNAKGRGTIVFEDSPGKSIAEYLRKFPKVHQESTRICPGCKVERDFVDDVNSLKTTCKSCRGTWDAFDAMFADGKWDEIERLNPVE